MLIMRKLQPSAFALMAMAALAFFPALGRAQAALLMEQPYGFFGSVNPTGHNAVYFAHICAATPVKLRRCRAGELGVVISRYQGIDGYDWIAIPLVPYLYSVEHPSNVPDHVSRETVERLRERYREGHLLSLGQNLPPGSLLHGGWTELVGVSYERRIYAFRFRTTQAQDDAFIARMNAAVNRSRFDLLFDNCSDFARRILNLYFPGSFRRSIFPDAGMTTPKQLAYKLERQARRDPEMQLTILEIPQIPGYRRSSRANKNIAESLTTTVYAVPLALVNPYLAGGIFVDYLVRGRHHLIPRHPLLVEPDDLSLLTAPVREADNPLSAGLQAASAAAAASEETEETATANSSLREIRDAHE